jgi:V8-like Glu-specific endopeptidase
MPATLFDDRARRNTEKYAVSCKNISRHNPRFTPCHANVAARGFIMRIFPSVSSAVLSSVVAIAAFGLTACSGAADNGTGSTDEAIVGGQVASTYPEAVFVDTDIDLKTNSEYACSGVIVAPKVVLTAGHCVSGHSTWEVTAPFVKGATAIKVSSATSNYVPLKGDIENTNSVDLGLLFLEKPIKLASYPTIATTILAAGAEVRSVGRTLNNTPSFTDLYYSQLEPVYTIVTNNGAAQTLPYSYITYDKIQGGDSGGPVMRSGTHQIVAVNSSSNATAGYETLARVDEESKWIAAEIAKH